MKNIFIALFAIATASVACAQEHTAGTLENVRSAKTEGGPMFVLNVGKKQLMLLDSSHPSALGAIDPGWIDRIDVFRNEQAIARFGDAGANGVVEIWLRESALKKMPKEIAEKFLHK
jgi:hypothetical protein